ncbi:hypothetical protein FS837_003358 [Tulasnella sp. UAMH 9824]|nr:hypothetical protein FS837_003358 [Tulasnella sp. UAMH 9824]
MRIKLQANSSARVRVLVNKTKDLCSAFTNALKYSEIKPSHLTTPTFEAQPLARADPELEDEPGLVYPAPLFAPRLTSSSGSTNSTSTGASTIFSRQSYRTASTVAGEGKELDKGKEKEDLIAAADKASGEDDEEEVVFMRSKRVASLSRNPYAAFLSQPSYKPPYIFPAGCSVDPNNA